MSHQDGLFNCYNALFQTLFPGRSIHIEMLRDKTGPAHHSHTLDLRSVFGFNAVTHYSAMLKQ